MFLYSYLPEDPTWWEELIWFYTSEENWWIMISSNLLFFVIGLLMRFSVEGYYASKALGADLSPYEHYENAYKQAKKSWCGHVSIHTHMHSFLTLCNMNGIEVVLRELDSKELKEREKTK